MLSTFPNATINPDVFHLGKSCSSSIKRCWSESAEVDRIPQNCKKFISSKNAKRGDEQKLPSSLICRRLIVFADKLGSELHQSKFSKFLRSTLSPTSNVYYRSEPSTQSHFRIPWWWCHCCAAAAGVKRLMRSGFFFFLWFFFLLLSAHFYNLWIVNLHAWQPTEQEKECD